jgi:polysaccharide biosynthesis/export protein
VTAPAAAAPPSPTASPSPLGPGGGDKPETPADYAIGPGDVLQIFVWKEPEVSREVRVRSDGKVTLPLLGDVMAAGNTTQTLATDLSQKLGRFLTAPKVAVSVTFASSLRFFVVGRVNKPGEFPLIGRVTVLEALALAGGFGEEAKTDKIVIVRRDPATMPGVAAAPALRRTGDTVLRVNYKKLASGKDLRSNAVLLPGDTVVVP